VATLAALPFVAAVAFSPASANETGLVLSGAYFRTVIPSRPAAGYFTLKNDTNAARMLVGASSSACGMLMMHKSETVNGVDKMSPVKSVSVPPHQSVSFAPGGFHLMCMSPGPRMMKPGGSVPVTLKFKNGNTLASKFPVRKPGGK
jgi:copper(I)-binding protein